MKTAIVTGVNGQDGSYLAEFLLDKGYRVIGTVRSKNPVWPFEFSPNHDSLTIYQMDLGYADSIHRLIHSFGHVDEVYNLAAQSHVAYSFEAPEETYRVTGVGACLLMDEFFAKFPDGKFYQASSSEMFGNRRNTIDGFVPASPYGTAKLMAHHNAKRHNAAGRFCVAGILYNHESERRHESFVTQKICKAVAKADRWSVMAVEGEEKPKLYLGNVEAMRDWGYAPEYVEIMWKMMQSSFPQTSHVIGTGISISVRDFFVKAYTCVGLDWREFVYIDDKYKRPKDIEYLRADPTSANNLLGRELTTVDQLVKIMVDHQIHLQRSRQ